MAETIVLDPTAVATGRTQLDITAWVKAEGIDWGDAAITQYLAEANRGQIPVDFRVPNRTITVPLVVKAAGTFTFANARTSIQAKVARIQQEGGWLSRTTSGGSTVYADVTNATLKLGGGYGQAYKDYDIDANLVLETVPDFYGAEIDLGDNVETTLPELKFTDTGVLGDYPGRVRIVVDEDDADVQLGLLWGYRARHYSSASTAALAYEVEALTTLDTATRTAITGASGGTVVRHGTLSVQWTPVASTNLQAGNYLTHTGSYRIWLRARGSASVGSEAPQVRFVYDVGDLTNPVENRTVQLPAMTPAWYMLDLGEVRLDAPPVGTHRWQGQIQAKAQYGGDVFDADRIFFQPLDDGAGKLTAPVVASEPTAFSARADFSSGGGSALNGQSLQVGGTWATSGGDADDFDVLAGQDVARRLAVSDATFIGTSSNVARLALAGSTTYTSIAVQCDMLVDSTVNSHQSHLVARYVDANNFLYVTFLFLSSDSLYIVIRSRVAGAETEPPGITLSGMAAANLWLRARIAVSAAGQVFVWAYRPESAPGSPVLLWQGDALATGGALATGRIGLGDTYYTGSDAKARWYDNFSAWVPAAEAVAFASQSVQVGTDGAYREDSTGTAWGPVAGNLSATLPRIPTSGLEGRTVETFLKLSRGDFDQIPDSGIDNISARPFYRPSWLFVS